MATPEQLSKIATRLRYHSLLMTTAAGSGHPTSCMSMAEIMATLFFHEMKYDIHDPTNLGNDEFVLSKGHAAPILWAALSEAGIIPSDELTNLRKIDSRLEGHPTTRMHWVKACTGSLGQGIGVAVGMAIAVRIAKSPARIYCVLGDGELAEGSVWEAANVAGERGLNNLVAIIDYNGIGQNGPTQYHHNPTPISDKFHANGWDCIMIEGHHPGAIMKALASARSSKKPFAIIARTVKGKGVSFMQDSARWHGKAATLEECKEALDEIGPMPNIDSAALVNPAPKIPAPRNKFTGHLKPYNYTKPTATRDGYGHALASLGKINPLIVAVDGDVRNSTRAEWFFKEFPERSIDCHIAEQAMAAIAMGLSAKGYIPFMSTFSAFMTRCHDQIRMAGMSHLDIKFNGSHAGISIGADGPSQMGLEDISLFRAIPNCLVLSPSDALSAEKCTEVAARHRWISYIRTMRPDTPIIYHKDEKFEIGGSKTLRKSPKDKAVIIATGITVHEALKAHAHLRKDGINVRVIDAYSIKPLDIETLRESSEATKGNLIVVEDHYPAGGLGEAVAMAMTGIAHITHLCVHDIPRSGEADELMRMFAIDADAIEKAVRRRLSR